MSEGMLVWMGEYLSAVTTIKVGVLPKTMQCLIQFKPGLIGLAVLGVLIAYPYNLGMLVIHQIPFTVTLPTLSTAIIRFISKLQEHVILMELPLSPTKTLRLIVYMVKDMVLDVEEYLTLHSYSVERQPVENLSDTFKILHKGIAMDAEKPSSFYKTKGYSGCTYPFRAGQVGAESKGSRRCICAYSAFSGAVVLLLMLTF